MPSTVSALLESRLTVTETFTGDYVSPGDNTVTINGLNETATYNASSAVPVTKVASFRVTLSSGLGSINLAALPGATADETVVGTGLKPQLVKFRNLATNANTITIVEGASNGHALLGASFSITLAPGQSILAFLDEAAQDVASGDRLLDITGTGSQILEVVIVLG